MSKHKDGQRLLISMLMLTPVALAQSWTVGPFGRPTASPVIAPDAASSFLDPITGKQVHWEALHTFNPAAIVKDGKIVVLYRAEDASGNAAIGGHTSRLGLAQSDDGIHFTRLPVPVFYPEKDAQEPREWPGGVEDPRIVVTDDGTYVLTYTQWNRTSYTVGVATSRDLRHWQKFGPVFDQAFDGKYRDLKYKSAAILTKIVAGRLVAARLQGVYWMYWGEIQIRLATSTDLIHWTPVEDANGEAKVLLQARPGLFDSGFPEVGAPPVLLPQGIVLFYNGKNGDADRDKTMGVGAYSAGQALFSSDDPSHLVSRMDHPYFKPQMPFEKSGQYVQGTVFTEGLVVFKRKWWMYYGTADSFVGVANARFDPQTK
jgi:predicted GH43/DUF377 family glycosyl hydrolase